MTDLCSVSTFGWFVEASSENLTPISTFGWWIVGGDIDPNTADRINFSFCINEIVYVNLYR